MNLCIRSGGQTGVDRAALDVGMDLGLKVGGFIPKGRRAEDGRLPDRYPLIELASRDYEPRTRRNVSESDATLVLYHGTMTPGSDLTVRIAIGLKRPYLAIDLSKDRTDQLALATLWLSDQINKCPRTCVLNVAGSRESSAPGIYEDAAMFLRMLFRALDSP